MLDEPFFDEQKDLQRTLRDVLRGALPPLSERDESATRRTAALDLWRQLVDVGVPAIGIDEQHGGFGGGLEELAVVSRELGRALAPTSIAAQAIAVRICAGLGDTSLAADLLAGLAVGRRIAVVSPQPGSGAWGEPSIDLEVRTEGDQSLVSGQLTGVIDIDVADRLLILVDNGRAGADSTVLVVDAQDDGLRVEASNNTGVLRTFSSVSLDDVPAAMAEVRSQDVRTALSHGRLLSAYEMLGAAEASIQIGSEYATTREQFGRPIGTFQAVSHRLAAVFIELQAAAASASHALRDQGSDTFELTALMARESASRTLTASCEAATQVLGAIAFTWEHPMHHYLKFAKSCERLWSVETSLESEIAAFLGGTRA